MHKRSMLTAAALVAVITTGAYAVVTFDPDTGLGFVGKGDVQLVYGWNNKALQDNAGSAQFRYGSASESTWTCSKPHPVHPEDIVQRRSNTNSTQGVLSSIARENSKGKDGPITGFHLLGWDGDPDVVVDGDEIGTCPAEPSGFTYDDNLVTNGAGGGLQVSINGSDWIDIQ